MKMTKPHFNHLKSEIDIVLKKYPNLVYEYENGLIPLAGKVKSLQVRFNNDLLYGAGLTSFVCQELYPYISDQHISTALNRICPKVEKKY
jgi:hypothetical protein